MNFGKISKKCLLLCAGVLITCSSTLIAQEKRPRIVVTTPSQTQVASSTSSVRTTRPGLTQPIIIVGQPKANAGLVKKTVMSAPIGDVPYDISRLAYGKSVNERLFNAIQARLGIRYRYGSSGPNNYDCSGLVWSVFRDAGLSFDRTSASMFWRNFEPVSGDEKYEFGTLVFFNKLGHVGIVANETGFYHASSSKGVTFSPFAGYWEKRIVGFRRIPKRNS